MEEKLFLKSIALVFQSQTLHWLQAQLYDFEDNLLQTTILTNGAGSVLPLQMPLRNFYFRITNQQNQICELFSYFWPEQQDQDHITTLSEIYSHFTLKIQIAFKISSKQDSPSKHAQQQQDHLLISRVGLYLQKIKERAFKALDKEQFFKAENNIYRCNFVRKKNHKNLTTLLVKNSTNILKTINQSVNKSATLKSFNQIKTQDTNQSSDDLQPSLFPPTPKLKKANSAQGPHNRQEGSKSILIPLIYEQTVIIPKGKKENICIKEPTLKKSSFLVKCKRQAYLKQLQAETMADLRNQEQTLSLIHSYIQQSLPV